LEQSLIALSTLGKHALYDGIKTLKDVKIK
jgi:hypothetical protein